jgi:hypothetical protein
MRIMRARQSSAALLTVVLALASPVVALRSDDPDAYRSEILKWRQDREARLKADDGWLTVAGLYWFKEGVNTFGTAESNDIVLPPGSAPPRVGTFEFRNGRTVVRVEHGPVQLKGKPVTTREIAADFPGPEDRLTLNALTFWVIKRGEHYGIRLRDLGSPIRREFTALRWFPIDPAYRVKGRLVRYPEMKHFMITNILGQLEDRFSPGYVVFMLQNRELRLEPALERPEARTLSFVFRDETAGHETYPAARFLSAEMPKDTDEVVLDFNKAYNPPCAYNPYTTCPLPQKDNILPIRIPAGERMYERR